MARAIIVVLIIILSGILCAQTVPEWLWAKRAGGTGGDSGTSVCQDAAGNSYVTGFFQTSATFGSQTIYASGGSNYDCFVAKADPSGNWLWAARAGAAGGMPVKASRWMPTAIVMLPAGSVAALPLEAASSSPAAECRTPSWPS